MFVIDPALAIDAIFTSVRHKVGYNLSNITYMVEINRFHP